MIMDKRLELLMMREQVMNKIESICDERLDRVLPQDDIDTLVTVLNDMICETLDPAGF